MQGWTDRARQASAVFGDRIILWLPSENPSDAARYPNCVHLVRLDNWTVDITPAQYVANVAPQVVRWRSGIGGNPIFVLGNEPDIEAGHNGAQVARYAAAMKVAFPGVAVANPPLSVEQSAKVVADGCDVVVLHSYFERQHPESMGDPQFGRSYRYGLDIAAGRPVYVTEFNVVQTNCPIDWPDRNRQAAAWLDQAERDGVRGACLFILDASPEWASFDIGPEAAREILAHRAPPAPPPPPVANPYAYDGDYAYDTFRAMVDGPLARKNPSVASRENYRAVHLAARSQGVSVPTMLGWCVAENVDPDLIAINNLAGIKYVGQSRAYQSNVLPPSNEQGVYAGFRTLQDFWETLAINIATVDPDAWARGDLATIARLYTGGAWGEAKVALVDRLRAMPHGPFEGDPPAPPPQPPPVARYRFVYPVDAPIVQGSDGAFSHGGKSPGFYALDYGCPMNTPIRCVADGTVIYNGFNHPREGQTGHTICVAHADGYESRYCHLSDYPAAVGDAVRQGQIIALSGAPNYPTPGANGYGSGAHLHFSISLNGTWVRCEELMATGAMGPWDGGPPVEETDVHTDGRFDDGRLRRLWDGPKTKAQIKSVGGLDPNRGVDDRWITELKSGRPVGYAVSKEEPMPTGGVIRYFSSGFICYYTDGSTTVN